MPKKFQGVNTKAVEARKKKSEKAAQLKEKQQKEADDALWVDDDKQALKKQQRKAAQEKKRLDAANKKKELQDLYKEEEDALQKAKKCPKSQKLTRAQIERIKQQDEIKKAEKKKAEELEKKRITLQEDLLTENVNKIIGDQVKDGEIVEARSVEEAISVLGIKEDVEKHPERRMKASYKKFEEQHMPLMKAENPSLRLSQLRQMLKKEWHKSPENPMNQQHSSYNSKA